MAIQEKQLGQLRPADTVAASLYSPPASTTAIIKSIVVSNTTGSAATFRIFLDEDGTTYDESTAHFFDVNIGANTTVIVDTYWAMDTDAGNLAVRSGTSNALTFTAYGAEIV